MQWRYRHTVLLLAVFGNFTQLGSRLLISPLVPQIIDAFQTSKGVIGLALTALWGVYALTQFPSGLLGDRYGEKWVILVALVLTGVGSLLVAAAPTFGVFGIALLVLGIGTGLYFSVASSLLSSLFSNQGVALSVHTAGGSIAGLVVPVVAAYIGVTYDWRAGILVGTALAFPTVAVIMWRVRPTPPDHPDMAPWNRADPALLRRLLSDPALAYTIFLSVVGVFAFQAYSSFFPTFLIEFRGLSTAIASVVFGGVFFLSAVSQPVAGRLSDAFERDAAVALSMTLTALGLGAVLLGSGPVTLTAGAVLMGVGMTWPGVLQARFMDNLTAEDRTLGFGLVRTVYMVIGASGSVVTGTVADAAGWLPAYGIVILLLVLAVATLVVARFR